MNASTSTVPRGRPPQPRGRGIAWVGVVLAGLMLTACAESEPTPVQQPTSTPTAYVSGNMAVETPSNSPERVTPKATPTASPSVSAAYVAARDEGQRLAEAELLSKAGLVNRLMSAQGGSHSRDAAEYAANHVSIDWLFNARQRADKYMVVDRLGKLEIYDRLVGPVPTGDGFTVEEAEFGIQKMSG